MSTFRIRSSFCGSVVLALCVSPALALSGAEVSWPELTARLERAALGQNVKGLREARSELLGMLAQPLKGEREVSVRYAVAYADWRHAYHPGVPEAEQQALLEEAVSQLEKALAIDSRFAEGHALLGSVQGARIGKSPWKGMTLGPRASESIDRALDLAPDNPRVVLQAGLNALHTPSLFGGGKAKAEERLRRAIALFEREQPNAPWPNWGRFDAHVWLGQILEQRQDASGARAEYEKALALAPESSWVRYGLLPKVSAGSRP